MILEIAGAIILAYVAVFAIRLFINILPCILLGLFVLFTKIWDALDLNRIK